MSWRDVQGVFFTHLHSDHVVAFPDPWLTGWLVSQRATPLLVSGPRGTQPMMARLAQAFATSPSAKPTSTPRRRRPELGEDLMVIEIGDAVTVRRPVAAPR